MPRRRCRACAGAGAPCPVWVCSFGPVVGIVKQLVHDVDVDKAELLVAVGARQRADDRKTQLLPQQHGAHVAADHVVELHGQVAELARLVEAVAAQQLADADALRDRGAHVANASFMVSPAAQGIGIGKLLGRHCLDEARELGYLAMQFNYVVSSNVSAVLLWKKLGFSIIGTLPRAYRHQQLGFVDVYVMYQLLDDPNNWPE